MSSRVFLSYTWESEEHKGWVRKLAARLRADGVNAILDQWHIAPGDQLPHFMERSVRDSAFVLVICTPRYKEKSDGRKGGVGYEGDIMTGEVFVNNQRNKFIPILRSGIWSDSAPSWLLGSYYLDLTGSEYQENSYVTLVDTLLGRRNLPPVIGTSRENADKIKTTEEALTAFNFVASDPSIFSDKKAKLVAILDDLTTILVNMPAADFVNCIPSGIGIEHWAFENAGPLSSAIDWLARGYVLSLGYSDKQGAVMGKRLSLIEEFAKAKDFPRVDVLLASAFTVHRITSFEEMAVVAKGLSIIPELFAAGQLGFLDGLLTRVFWRYPDYCDEFKELNAKRFSISAGFAKTGDTMRADAWVARGYRSNPRDSHVVKEMEGKCFMFRPTEAKNLGAGQSNYANDLWRLDALRELAK